MTEKGNKGFLASGALLMHRERGAVTHAGLDSINHAVHSRRAKEPVREEGCVGRTSASATHHAQTSSPTRHAHTVRASKPVLGNNDSANVDA